MSDLLEYPLFTFAVIADPRIDSSSVDDGVMDAATEINTIPGDYAPSFTMFVGNIVDSASVINLSYAKRAMTGFDAPVHIAIGNLDCSDGDKTKWENQFGARNYSFDVEGIHCIVLDSTKPSSFLTYGGGFEPDTLAWLTDHLTGVETDTPIIVFSHHCPWSPMLYQPRINLFEDVENGGDVLTLFASHTLLAWFSGHARQSLQYMDLTGTTKFISSASMDANDAVNVDYSAPGYTLVEVYDGYVKTYWIPLGLASSHYIKPKTYEVSVGTGGEYNGNTNVQIQLAANACGTNGGGTVVMLEETFALGNTYPDATSPYQAPVRLPANVWLIGVSKTGTILRFVDSIADPMNKVGVSSKWIGGGNHRLENFTIDGNKDNNLGGENSTHVWYCGTAFDGDDPSSLPAADSKYAHDIIIEDVVYKNFWHTGFCHYANRRYTVRDNSFDNMNTAMTPDHPCEFGQIEGNVTTNTPEVCEAADNSHTLFYRNTVNDIKTLLLWWGAYLPGSTMLGNKCLYNTVNGSTEGSGHLTNVQQNIGADIEVIGNTFNDIDYGDACLSLTAMSYQNQKISGNSFNNVTIPKEIYNNSPSTDLTAPTSITFAATSPTSATVTAVGGTYQGGASNVVFQKAEYDGESISITSADRQSSHTYQWNNLDPDKQYAFRVRSDQTSTWFSAWTPWIFLSPELTNHKPILQTIGNKTIVDGKLLSFTIEAMDEDDDSLTYSASNLPQGATFTPATRTFNWTPNGQTGNHTLIHFEVTDGQMTAEEDITIAVISKKLIFVWGISTTILNTLAELTRFLYVCDREGINIAAIQMDSDTLDDFETSAMLDFVTACNAVGIDVHAIIGGIVGDLTNIPQAHYDYLDAIIKYNQDNVGKEIKGIVWNIEETGDAFDDAYDYMIAMRGHEYNNESIVDQGLELAFDLSGEYNNQDFIDLIGLLDFVLFETYEDQLDSGAGDGILGVCSVGMACCEANSKPFISGQETDELTPASSYKSVYEEGRDGYQELNIASSIALADTYDMFAGKFFHQYQRSGETWHQITSDTFEYSGQIVTATITLKNSGYYQTSARGIVLQVKDDLGNIYEERVIRALTALQERGLEISVTLPEGTDPADCSARVMIYDLDKRGDSRDPVYSLWATHYSEASLPSDMEVCPLEDFTAAIKTDPDFFDGYGRQEPELVIQAYTDWTTLGEGEPPLPPTPPAAAVSLKLILL